jgi:hypothetical protein
MKMKTQHFKISGTQPKEGLKDTYIKKEKFNTKRFYLMRLEKNKKP